MILQSTKVCLQKIKPYFTFVLLNISICFCGHQLNTPPTFHSIALMIQLANPYKRHHLNVYFERDIEAN